MTVVLHVQNGFHSGVDRGEKCPLKLDKEPNLSPTDGHKKIIDSLSLSRNQCYWKVTLFVI